MNPRIQLQTRIAPELVEPIETFLYGWAESPWGVLRKDTNSPYLLFGYFPDAESARSAYEQLRAEFPAIPENYEESSIQDADWQETYKEFVQPWHTGHLHWIPLWERKTHSTPPGAATVYLDAGMAFGTGTHETTRLCARRLVEYRGACSNQAASELTVIDAGCGSGVLALSAAALGFKTIHAFDSDPDAIDVCHANARENPHIPKIPFAVADLDSGLPPRCADLLLANIQTNLLRTNADKLIYSLRHEGTLVLSGILAAEMKNLRAHFEKRLQELGRNAKATDSRTDGEWADLKITLEPGD